MLTFSAPLDAAHAQDVRNYTLVPTGPAGHSLPHTPPIPIASAVYDPGSLTVTLSLRSQLDVHRYYRLTVNGTPPAGLSSFDGVLLDGSGSGRPGTDYVALVHGLPVGPVVPATITVTSLADAGPGTLRAAIEQADLDPAGDTITFTSSVRGTITLSSALPDLSTAIDIEGPGPAALTVARSGAAGTPDFRIFTVPAGAVVTIAGLTISGGVVSNSSDVFGGFGGGIYNAGTLSITNSTLSFNSANAKGGSGLGGNTGLGGGIYNAGTLSITNSTLSGNSANGVIGNDLTSGQGGAIENFGTLSVTNSTLSGNSANGFYPEGGAIFNFGALSVTNSTLSGNSANGGISSGSPGSPGYLVFAYGGGIFNESPGTLSVTNSTLSGNSANAKGGGARIGGGGIDNGGSLSFSMSIFANPVGGNLDT